VSSPLAPIAAALLDAFAPLDRALHDPHSFQVLLRNLGWEKEIEDEVLAGPPLADLAASSAALLDSGEKIVAALADGPQDNDELFEELVDVIGSLHDLIAGLDGLDTAALPQELRDPSMWAALALDLPDYLTVRYLERHQHVLYGLLRLAGVVEDDNQALEATNGRLSYVRRRIVWDNLVALVGDPAGHLESLYHWDDGKPFDHARLLDELARFAGTVGVHFERLPLRRPILDSFYGSSPPPADVREAALPVVRARIDGVYTEQGVLVAPVPPKPGGDVDGLYLTNLSWGRAGSAPVELAPGWTLAVTGSVDATGAVGAHLRPGVVELVAEPVEASVELAVEGLPQDGPWLLIGAATGPRIELGGLRIALEFDTTPEPDVTVSAQALPSADRGGIAVTVDPADGDGFVQRLMPFSARADADPDLRWSGRHGVSLGGTAGLDVVVPIEKSLGPLTVDSLHLALTGGNGGASLLAAITGGVSLPPLDILVMDIGVVLGLEPGASDGLVDGLGMTVTFKPPLGVGLDLDLGDAASGGGFIAFEAETGRYYGNVSLSFAKYGLGAMFVIDTRLPGDPPWALFASISGTWPGLPLGFGFVLTGLGGLLALNRTMDVEALAAGLKSGAADAVMFPEDPLGDAAVIVSDLDAWFPIADGSFVFGLAAEIAWGAKTLVTADLGIVIAYPDLDVVVLGTLTSVMPTEDEALLELHMDTLGVIDLSEGTVLITSSLYDSSLMRTLHLSGDSVLYARFADDPFFLLAIGGYHPAFQPPGGLPGTVYDLDRMRASIEISDDASFSLEAYFAITSNTLQFGSHAALVVSSKFLEVTYTARGEVGFDVLLVLTPFSFVADFEASVAITAGTGDHELLAVSLAAHLEGPDPWACSGSARFTFLGIDVRFEIDVGGSPPDEAPSTENVLEQVAAALGQPSAWRSVAPAAAAVLVAADDPTDDEVWATPDSDLEAVQDLAPLDRELDHYGAYAIAGPRELTIAGAGVDGAGKALVWTAAQGYFAPAQYDDLTRSEMLAAPSYEEMTAGVSFGIDGIALPDADDVRSVTTSYERAVVDGDVKTPLDDGPLLVPLTTATFGHIVLRGRKVSGSSPLAFAEPAWETFDAVTGHATSPAGRYRDAVLARRSAPRGADRVAPAYAGWQILGPQLPAPTPAPAPAPAPTRTSRVGR
jgi:hypothetical protein